MRAASGALCAGMLGCGAADSRRDEPAVLPLACELVAAVPLPPLVTETSGLAAGRNGVFWTHNDRGHPAYVHAIDTVGQLVGSVAIVGPGEISNVDWEDIESAPCGDARCLFIADIGDNQGMRNAVAIHVLREPPAGSRASAGRAASATARTLILRYPDGPQDAEAMFVVDGSAYIITKGEHASVTLFRVPSATRISDDPTASAAMPPASGPFTLEPVRNLGARRVREAGKVTGASTSPDGRWVAVRSYDALHLFEAGALVRNQAIAPRRFDLRPLREPQGEGVLLLDDGTVWLTSESESGAVPPRLTHLRCELPPVN